MDALDRTDDAIVAALQNNGRLSNKELAARVGLAPSSCLQRVRRLFERGVVRGVHADVDPRALGIGMQALIALRLRRHSRASALGLKRHLLTRPEVVTVFNLTGAEDFLVHVAVRDSQHLYDFALDALATRPEVEHINTSLVFDLVTRRALPHLVPRPEPTRRRRDARRPR
jgi:DNA-binding Lrp family transcriptional regulator